MSEQMRQIVLARRPEGAPVPGDFRLETVAMPRPDEGEVLVRITHFSLDPYMRGRMDDAKSYAQPVPLGGRMEGGAVGEVIESRAEGLAAGDTVFGMLGWGSHAVAPARELRRLDPRQGPATAALGVLGMPGFTGWFGLTEFGRPKAGETLVVAAATGPVGSMVGQIAKARGLRAIGIAGGAEKCALACESLGFDACIDHRAHGTAGELRAALAEVCPDGIDIYFENVGGKVLAAVLPMLNTFARIPLCGMISGYNKGALGGVEGEGPDRLPAVWRAALVKRLSLRGFIISDHWAQYPAFLKEVAPMVAKGEIAYREDIAEGLDAAPQAFIGMLEGRNFGKQIVRVS